MNNPCQKGCHVFSELQIYSSFFFSRVLSWRIKVEEKSHECEWAHDFTTKYNNNCTVNFFLTQTSDAKIRYIIRKELEHDIWRKIHVELEFSTSSNKNQGHCMRKKKLGRYLYQKYFPLNAYTKYKVNYE